jgi:LacI family transcriptional regulator
VNPARKIADRLRSEILAGKWSDRPLPSERSLSASCRVARLTARKALRQLCLEHLIEARPSRGYVVAAGAAGAAGTRPAQQARVVLFFYVDSTGAMALDPIDTALVNGASDEARRHGLDLFATCQEPAAFRRIIAERRGKDLHGVLLDWARRDLAESLIAAEVPFVVVEDDLEGLPVVAVIQDNAAGVRLALEHLAGRGHRRIGLLVDRQESIHPLQRLTAYREFVLSSGLDADPGLIAKESSGADSDWRAVARLLDLEERPTAIFVANRGLLTGVLEEMAARSLECPRDVSLVVWGEPGTGEPAGGIDNLSFVAWDRREMGRMAVLALEERIRLGRSERMVFRIGTRLVERGSVGSPPAGGAGRR